MMVSVIDPFDDGGLQLGDILTGFSERVISANNRSTMLSQEQAVRVKCNLQRGLRASQRFTAGVLWVA